ncbi:MAG: hypothetical protein WC613_00715 [Candidatus Aenigmatarchaeota archaeon]
MGERGTAYRSDRIRRTHAKIPFPIYPGTTFIGYDESGFFPPKTDEYAARFKRMVLCATLSNNPVDGAVFTHATELASYIHQSGSKQPQRLWTELNGAHSRSPVLSKNSIAARMVCVARLIMELGYTGSVAAPAYIDRFWPRQFDGLFYSILGYYGVKDFGNSLYIEHHADTHVRIVKDAEREAKHLWHSPSRHSDHADSFLDVSPDEIARCMAYMAKNEGAELKGLRDFEFRDTSSL